MKVKAWVIACGLAVCLFVQSALAGPFEDGQAAYKRGDYATALQLWQPLAEQGNAVAQSNIGFIYSNGLGVPRNYAEALKWFKLSAAQGYAEAQHSLGTMHGSGQGVPQDAAAAVKWYRLAADH